MNLSALNIEAVEHHELKSARSGEKFSLSVVLTDLLNFKDMFVHHEIIPAGRRASAPHTHSRQEEMLFVLEGSPTVHHGTQSVQLRPGDFFGFKPGARDLHFVENNTAGVVRVLVIASNPQDDQVYYETPPE